MWAAHVKKKTALSARSRLVRLKVVGKWLVQALLSGLCLCAEANAEPYIKTKWNMLFDVRGKPLETAGVIPLYCDETEIALFHTSRTLSMTVLSVPWRNHNTQWAYYSSFYSTMFVLKLSNSIVQLLSIVTEKSENTVSP